MAESYSGYVEMEPKMEDEKFSGFWEYSNLLKNA